MGILTALQELLHNNQILGATTVMAAGGGLIYSLKGIPMRIYKLLKSKLYDRFVYTVTIHQFDDLYPLFEKWLAKTHPSRYRNVMAFVYYNNTAPQGAVTYDHSGKIIKRPPPKVVYDQAPNTFFIRFEGKLIMISKEAEKLEGAMEFRNRFGYRYVISGLKCRAKLEGLLAKLVEDDWHNKNKNAVRIFSHTSYGEWQNIGPLNVKNLSAVVLEPELKQSIIQDIDIFRTSREWYKSVDIPYKRGFAFQGPPGTGKTTLAKAIAMYAEKDIYYLNLSTITNDSSLQDCFSNIGNDAVLLIEDIDAAFAGREGTSKITLSGLLNCIDGIYYKEGLILCMTTNHPEKLDKALLRSGRTDRIINIGYPKVEQIVEYMEIFYKDYKVKMAGNLVNNHVPMSEIQEICISNRDTPSSAILEVINRLNVTN